jgi:hypothetical protein
MKKFFTANNLVMILLVVLLGILLYMVFSPSLPINMEGFKKKSEEDGGSCFNPKTKLKLQNGDIVEMQNLKLTDVLENGSTIFSIMKVRNTNNVKYYKFEKCGVDGEDIFVTGSHFVLGNDGKFILVEKHPDAKLDDSTNIPEWFSCLITNDHKIKIGNKTFWDWEECTDK